MKIFQPTVSTGGTGTVTSFNFTDGSGFDGTVINSTTVPTLSLTTQLTATRVPFIGLAGALTQNSLFNYTTSGSFNKLVLGADLGTNDILSVQKSALAVGISSAVGKFVDSSTYSTTIFSPVVQAGYFSAEGARTIGANPLTNIGIYTRAVNAQNNYAIIVPFNGGRVGLGTSSPTFDLDLQSEGSQQANFQSVDDEANIQVRGSVVVKANFIDDNNSEDGYIGWDNDLFSIQATGTPIYLDPLAQNVAVGFNTVPPTAHLHIAGGSATAGTAPLKINSGTLLSTTEAGALENNGTHLYFTFANSGTRYQLDQQGGGGSPGGSNTQLQYNNSGSFGGIAGLLYNGTNLNIGIPFITANGSGAAGVDFSLTTGNGDSGFNGGNITLLAGDTSGDAALAGSITLTAGGGSVGRTQSGDILLSTKASHYNSGNISLSTEGDDGIITEPGATTGSIQLSTGSTGADGINAGFISIASGGGFVGDANGGAIFMTSGNGSGSGHGGDINITAQYGGDSGGLGGSVNLLAGNGGANGGIAGGISINAGNGGPTPTGSKGADVNIIAGSAIFGNNNGGDLFMVPGVKSGLGLVGHFNVFDPVSNLNAVFNTASLATSDKLFTFPNLSGVLNTTTTGRATAQTAANTNVVTATVGTSDGSFLISANVLVTTSTVHSFTTTVTYTDESNVSRTASLTFSNLAATLQPTITNAGGAGPYEGVPLHIRAKASTTITIATTGTFTTVTYNVEGSITQIA